jgi:N6-L-threonylcarbamoyladenine synthase
MLRTAALLRSHRARLLARLTAASTASAGPAAAASAPPQQTRSAAAAAAAPLPPAREPLFALFTSSPSGQQQHQDNSNQDEERLVLGIESSCDDTAAAVVSASGRVLSAASASQQEVHARWGGVVPALARHAHRAAIDGVVQQALEQAGVRDPARQLAAVAVTVGPGLSLCLDVGVRKARSVARAAGVPLVPVHHMEAHALVARLAAQQQQQQQQQEQQQLEGAAAAAADTLRAAKTTTPPPPALPFPFLCLLVSGGHNLLVLARGVGDYALLGTTLDDAAGEALDKVARMLGLPAAPHGGAALEQLALSGDARRFPFPPPMKKRRNCDFSYAGLKTSARMAIERELGQVADGAGGVEQAEEGNGGDDASATRQQVRADLAASFQRAAVDHLVERTRRGVEWARQLLSESASGGRGGGGGGDGSDGSSSSSSDNGRGHGHPIPPPPVLRHLVVAGGVACNRVVRASLDALARDEGLALVAPPASWCTDNGVMVAWAGCERAALGLWQPAPDPLPSLSDEAYEAARTAARESWEQAARQYGEEALGGAARSGGGAGGEGGGGGAGGGAGGGGARTLSREEAAALGEWVELRPRWPLTSEVAAGATGDVLSKKRADKQAPSLTDLTRRALRERG